MPGRKFGYSGQRQQEALFHSRRRQERNAIFSGIMKTQPGTIIQRVMRLPQQSRKTQTLRLKQISNLLQNPGGVNATRTWAPPVGQEEYAG